MSGPEATLERNCTEVARGNGCILLKLYPILRGLPDRILLAPGGKLLFIEFKRPGGRVTPMQLIWRDRLLALGFNWVVVDSVPAFRVQLGLTLDQSRR
jgi:hypothetical protein